MIKLNKKQATEKWVGEFNAINSSLLERAFKDDIDNWIELTPITIGDYVYYDGEYCRVIEADYDKDYDGINFRKSKLTLELNKPETKWIDAALVGYIEYNDELLEVYGTEDDAFLVTINGKDERVSFEDISKIEYEESELKVISVEDGELEVEIKTVEVDYDDVEHERDGWLPMWGTLWTFGESIDEDWARTNPELVAACGFRVFEDYETGDIYIGIDGAGYSFYPRKARIPPPQRSRWGIKDSANGKARCLNCKNIELIQD
ncbi:MAG: hypothetical protein IJ086_05690 [Clostridium sp.]|nr:hypothetical protein [Clostridium sp.]